MKRLEGPKRPEPTRAGDYSGADLPVLFFLALMGGWAVGWGKLAEVTGADWLYWIAGLPALIPVYGLLLMLKTFVVDLWHHSAPRLARRCAALFTLRRPSRGDLLLYSYCGIGLPCLLLLLAWAGDLFHLRVPAAVLRPFGMLAVCSTLYGLWHLPKALIALVILRPAPGPERAAQSRIKTRIKTPSRPRNRSSVQSPEPQPNTERRRSMPHTTLIPVKERFEQLFGPESANRPNLPAALRATVYARMRFALEVQDGRSVKRVKTYFLKTFHPDSPDSAFTKAERQAVFVTIPHIFDGDTL